MKSILRQTIVAVIIFISFFARSESMDSLNEKTVDELLNYALSDKLAIASSYLIDKKLPKEFYNPNNVYDDKLDTKPTIELKRPLWRYLRVRSHPAKTVRGFYRCRF